MAGHRRTRKPGTPTARQRHYDNARTALMSRLDATTDPVQRMRIALGYATAAYQRHTRRGASAVSVALLETVTRALVRVGDQLNAKGR